MIEQDVALSDYAIAIIALTFTVLVLRAPAGNRAARGWLAVLFLGVAAAAALGGTVHGFLNLDRQSISHFIAWRATLVAIGITALGGWGFGANLLFSPPAARIISGLAGLGFLIYCGIILFISQQYRVAIINYLPAALFLLLSFGWLALRARTWLALGGFIGVLLTFAAAAIQQLQISLHPVYLSHNTLYHLVQSIGLLLIFLGGRWAFRPQKADMP